MVNVLMWQVPLLERIARWAESGKAKSIPLHPRDYFVLSKAGHVETISEKYSLEVKCLGGEEALKEFVKEKMDESKMAN